MCCNRGIMEYVQVLRKMVWIAQCKMHKPIARPSIMLLPCAVLSIFGRSADLLLCGNDKFPTFTTAQIFPYDVGPNLISEIAVRRPLSAVRRTFDLLDS